MSKHKSVLVTTSRMPFAVDAIRKFGEAGWTVYAADTFEQAPGSHSKWVERQFVVPSPRHATEQFVQGIGSLCRRFSIGLLAPAFEEVLYLAARTEVLPPVTRCFFSPLPVLARLHDKIRFQALATELGLSSPRSCVVTDRAGFEEAARSLGSFFARPRFSRGGVSLVTNTGPHADPQRVAACRPSPEEPWLMQQYVHGEEVCSYSIALRGRLLVHLTYAHPNTINRAGGVTFASLDSEGTLPAAAAVAAATGYTGQFGLDFLQRADDGALLVVECNPRPTAGLSLLTSHEFAAAFEEDPPPDTFVCPPGRRRKIASGLVLDMLRNWSNIPEDLVGLITGGPDLYARPGDPLPGLYQLLSYTHVLDYQRQMPEEAHYDLSDVVRAQFFDVCWDGTTPEGGRTLGVGRAR